jgi:putative lipoprotein
MRTSFALVVVAIMALFGCAAAGADPDDSVADYATVSGLVVLREPAALPAATLLTVTLEDVSLADAPAVIVGQTQFEVKDQLTPIPFTIVYPVPAAQPGSVYGARARLTLGDRLLFTTTQRDSVDPFNPLPIELVVDSVATETPPLIPDVSLTSTFWKIIEVDGQPVAAAQQMREPQLVLNGQDGRFAGSGGVNRLMGSYLVDGKGLTFSQVASTMMAGAPEAMQQEQTIVVALGAVRGFSIAGDQLTLVNDSGQPVLRAIAVALR